MKETPGCAGWVPRLGLGGTALAAVCKRSVVTIEAAASIREAARLMRQKRIGALVVATGRKPKGIITDRDIVVAVVAEGLDPAEVPVGDVMQAKPVVIREDKSTLDALRLVDAEAVRRLPVVDSRGDLSGIIALARSPEDRVSAEDKGNSLEGPRGVKKRTRRPRRRGLIA